MQLFSRVPLKEGALENTYNPLFVDPSGTPFMFYQPSRNEALTGNSIQSWISAVFRGLLVGIAGDLY